MTTPEDLHDWAIFVVMTASGRARTFEMVLPGRSRELAEKAALELGAAITTCSDGAWRFGWISEIVEVYR